MKFTKSIIYAILIVFGILAFSTGESNAWPRHRLYKDHIVTVSKPGPYYIWIEGHWKINKHGKKVWVPGHWKKV